MDRLLLLCAALALLLPHSASDSAVRCGRPKDVANAFIDAGDAVLLHTSLRYTCKLGYKRKAGTSTLIQCVLDHGKPVWTSTELQCIRDPALPLQTLSPELLTMRTGDEDRGTTTTPAAAPVPSPETSMAPAMPEPPEMPTPGEGTALRTTPLPTNPEDHAAVSTQTLASSIGLSILLIVSVAGFCYWRMKMHARQNYVVAVTAIPMVAPTTAAENDEMLPPGDIPTG
ncbi:interleukin-15 receptor subunit alpha-like isoform X2 [Numida meleagris]|uniref:interleukin-15 receptor subunit alpha-like isoform X2 n=1 Tax=Numida meleagris TaxID=8996 RepID=UPI000B3D877F|nr:interleukin-15 receptor subunit alpha-like isoform X2 [Numida meleagris]